MDTESYFKKHLTAFEDEKASFLQIGAYNGETIGRDSIAAGIWAESEGREKEAWEEVMGLMKVGSDGAEARQALLQILSRQVGDLKAPFVFGLGTGRSGSTSLTLALGGWSNSYFSHEHPSLVPWQNGEEVVDWHMARLTALGQHYKIVGDVSHWWLPYVERIHKRHPSSIFIVMRRDPQKTVESFLRIKGGGAKDSLNHWQDHDGSYFRKHYWDQSYPKYENCENLRQALEFYWSDYYREAERLRSLLPNNVLIVDLEASNKGELIHEFARLHFGEIAGEVRFEKMNSGTISDGSALWPKPAFL